MEGRGVCAYKDKRNTVYSTVNGDIHPVEDVTHLLKKLTRALLSRPLYLPEDLCKQQGLQQFLFHRDI